MNLNGCFSKYMSATTMFVFWGKGMWEVHYTGASRIQSLFHKYPGKKRKKTGGGCVNRVVVVGQGGSGGVEGRGFLKHMDMNKEAEPLTS